MSNSINLDDMTTEKLEQNGLGISNVNFENDQVSDKTNSQIDLVNSSIESIDQPGAKRIDQSLDTSSINTQQQVDTNTWYQGESVRVDYLGINKTVKGFDVQNLEVYSDVIGNLELNTQNINPQVPKTAVDDFGYFYISGQDDGIYRRYLPNWETDTWEKVYSNTGWSSFYAIGDFAVSQGRMFITKYVPGSPSTVEIYSTSGTFVMNITSDFGEIKSLDVQGNKLVVGDVYENSGSYYPRISIYNYNSATDSYDFVSQIYHTDIGVANAGDSDGIRTVKIFDDQIYYDIRSYGTSGNSSAILGIFKVSTSLSSNTTNTNLVIQRDSTDFYFGDYYVDGNYILIDKYDSVNVDFTIETPTGHFAYDLTDSDTASDNYAYYKASILNQQNYHTDIGQIINCFDAVLDDFSCSGGVSEYELTQDGILFYSNPYINRLTLINLNFETISYPVEMTNQVNSLNDDGAYSELQFISNYPVYEFNQTINYLMYDLRNPAEVGIKFSWDATLESDMPNENMTTYYGTYTVASDQIITLSPTGLFGSSELIVSANYGFKSGVGFYLELSMFDSGGTNQIISSTYINNTNKPFLIVDSLLKVDFVWAESQEISSNLRSDLKYASSEQRIHRLEVDVFDYRIPLQIYSPLEWNLTSITPTATYSWDDTNKYWYITNTIPATYTLIFNSGTGWGIDYARQPSIVALFDVSSDYLQSPSFESGSYSEMVVEKSGYTIDTVELSTDIVFSGSFSLHFVDTDSSRDILNVLDKTQIPDNYNTLWADGDFYLSFSYYRVGNDFTNFYYRDSSSTWNEIDLNGEQNRWTTVYFYIDYIDSFRLDTVYDSADEIEYYFDNFFIGKTSGIQQNLGYSEYEFSSQFIYWDGYQNPSASNLDVEWSLRDRTANTEVISKTVTTDQYGIASYNFKGNLEMKEYESRWWSWDNTFSSVDISVNNLLNPSMWSYADNIVLQTDGSLLLESITGADDPRYTFNGGSGDLSNVDYIYFVTKSSVSISSNAFRLYPSGGARDILYFETLQTHTYSTISEKVWVVPDTTGAYTSGVQDLDSISYMTIWITTDSYQLTIYQGNFIQAQKNYFTPIPSGYDVYSYETKQDGSKNYFDYSEGTDEELNFVSNNAFSTVGTSQGYVKAYSTASTLTDTYMRFQNPYYEDTNYNFITIRVRTNVTIDLYVTTVSPYSIVSTIAMNVPNDENWYTYTAEINTDLIKTNGAVRLRIINSVTFGIGDYFDLDYIYLFNKDTGYDQGYAWEFEEPNYNSWTINGRTSGINNLAISEGFMAFDTSSTDPYIYYQNSQTVDNPLSYDISDFADTFELSIYSSSAENIELRIWDRSANLLMNSIVGTTITNEFTTISISISSITEIGYFRLDFGVTSNIKFKIDYVRFYDSSNTNGLYETEDYFYFQSENNTLQYYYELDGLTGIVSDNQIIWKNQTVGPHTLIYSPIYSTDPTESRYEFLQIPSTFYYYTYTITNEFNVQVQDWSLSDYYVQTLVSANMGYTYTVKENGSTITTGSSSDGSLLSIQTNRNTNPGVFVNYQILFTNDTTTLTFTISYSNSDYQDDISSIVIVDQQNNYLEARAFKIYVDSSRIYSDMFVWTNTSSTKNLTITDIFDNLIFQDTALSYSRFIDIVLTLYSVKIKNVQENPIYIYITRGTKIFSEWVLPEEIIEYKLESDSYNFTIVYSNAIGSQFGAATTNGTSVSFIYTVSSDTALLITGKTIQDVFNNVLSLSQDLQNVNATLSNQIVNVDIRVQNVNTSISNQIVNVDIRLDNVNTTLNSQLVSITSDITNLKTNITLQLTDINSTILNVNSTLFSQTVSILSNLSNVNSTLFSQTLSILSDISNVNSTLYSQTVSILSSISNVNSTLYSQTLSILSDISNVNSTIYSQTVTILSDISNVNSTLYSQTVTILSQISNVNSTLYSQTLTILSNISNMNSTIYSQTVTILSDIQNTNSTIYNQTVSILSNLSNVNSTLYSQTLSIISNISNVNSTLYSQTLSILSDIQNINSTLYSQTVSILSQISNYNSTLYNQTIDILTQIDLTNSTQVSLLITNQQEILEAQIFAKEYMSVLRVERTELIPASKYVSITVQTNWRNATLLIYVNGTLRYSGSESAAIVIDLVESGLYNFTTVINGTYVWKSWVMISPVTDTLIHFKFSTELGIGLDFNIAELKINGSTMYSSERYYAVGTFLNISIYSWAGDLIIITNATVGPTEMDVVLILPIFSQQFENIYSFDVLLTLTSKTNSNYSVSYVIDQNSTMLLKMFDGTFTVLFTPIDAPKSNATHSLTYSAFSKVIAFRKTLKPVQVSLSLSAVALSSIEKGPTWFQRNVLPVLLAIFGVASIGGIIIAIGIYAMRSFSVNLVRENLLEKPVQDFGEKSGAYHLTDGDDLTFDREVKRKAKNTKRRIGYQNKFI